jgi:subtilisin family serine protease
MKTPLLFFSFLLLSLGCFSQISQDYYLIEFTDKNDSPYSIEHPEAFLSQKAIERRTKYSIPVSQQDFPVNSTYITAVKDIGVKYIQQTRWLNAIVIKTSDVSKLTLISELPFVKKVMKNRQMPGQTEESVYPKTDFDVSKNNVSSIDYGQAFSQISMVGGIGLHNQGFLGEGLSIAVLDGGFSGANFMHAFDSLRINGQIKGTLNLVGGGTYVYQGTQHGSNVLSVLAANVPGVMVGTAPKANYYLIRSEDTNGESLLEEYNWVTGAEYADSAGADIISTSLSYTLSSDPATTLTFDQLDGQTAPITLAAEIAGRKGMIVIASAGNNGENQGWLHVGFPADGDSVFAIGAVDAHGIRASFSSPGPTFDDRIKPDVMAMGVGTTVMKSDGTVGSGDGTSFATPIIAGLAACLWQSYPDMNNMDILRAIRNSCTQYMNPDDMMGYGIPDFSIARNSLSISEISGSKENIVLSPNPFTNDITIHHLPERVTVIDAELMDLTGKIFFDKHAIPVNWETSITLGNLSFIPEGFYLLKINTQNGVYVNKIVKINN